MNREKILIIEDELQMRYLLRTHLSNDFELDEASNGIEGLNLINRNQYTLVLLDIMMEGMDGWDVCRTIRESGKQVPIIMLTARGDVKDKVQGLNIGADDYVVKPFDPDELIARIQALLRRTEDIIREDNSARKGILKIKELKIDSNAREVYVNNRLVEFTLKEFDLLYNLASNPNWVYSRDMLLNTVWGQDKILDFRTVDSHVKHVRDKLTQSGLSFNPIKTVWGVGYKFNLPNDER